MSILCTLTGYIRKREWGEEDAIRYPAVLTVDMALLREQLRMRLNLPGYMYGPAYTPYLDIIRGIEGEISDLKVVEWASSREGFFSITHRILEWWELSKETLETLYEKLVEVRRDMGIPDEDISLGGYVMKAIIYSSDEEYIKNVRRFFAETETVRNYLQPVEITEEVHEFYSGVSIDTPYLNLSTWRTEDELKHFLERAKEND